MTYQDFKQRARPAGELIGNLRAQLERRRQARKAASVCAALAFAAAVGAGIADAYGNTGGAVVLGIAAALAILVGSVAASEA